MTAAEIAFYTYCENAACFALKLLKGLNFKLSGFDWLC